MPPLLCPSPVILDHSFPRSLEDLRSAARALGELMYVVDQGRAGLALTGALRQFVELFEWERVPAEMPVLLEVHRLSALLFMAEHPGLIELAVPAAEAGQAEPHPRPRDASDGGLVDYWCSEVGELYALHEHASTPKGRFCVGVACAGLFSGNASPGYEPPDAVRVFPLVGPDELDVLVDAFDWDVPADSDRQKVSFADAYRNLRTIGAERIEPPKGGSHYKVRFPGARPFALDPNVDPLPDRFLEELTEITSYPLRVVRFALKKGRLPPRKLRFAAS